MTEIQEAFEKWQSREYGNRSSYSLERWNQNWPQPVEGQTRLYTSLVTEEDFRVFLAGWEAAKNV